MSLISHLHDKKSKEGKVRLFELYLWVMKKLFALVMFGLAGLVLHAGSPTDVVCGPWISDVTQTSFTVNWVTEGATLSWVEAGVDDGRVFYASEKQKYYQTVAGKRVTGSKHSVKVTGLQPGTQYIYRICGKRIADDNNAYFMKYGSEKASKAKNTVRTLDHSADSCRFAIVSDIHGKDEHFKTLTNSLKPQDLDFFVVNGDLVSEIYDINKATHHAVDPVQSLVANLPYFYVRGNHEGRGRAHYQLTDIFPMREKDGWYYTFRQGPVAFIVLDAGEDKPDSDVEYGDLAEYDPYREAQLEWLKEAVKRPEIASAPVKICLMHIPAFKDKTTWYAQNWANENFVPVLNEAGVNLMLSGHIHKHKMIEAGHSGNNFPIICSSNKERFIVSSDGKTITVKAYDTEGRLTNSYTF